MSAAEVIKQELDKAAGFGTGAWGDRVLEALKAAGYAVVEVPSQQDLRHGFALEVRRDRILDHGPIDAYTQQDARDFAAALLAAADAAEVSE